MKSDIMTQLETLCLFCNLLLEALQFPDHQTLLRRAKGEGLTQGGQGANKEVRRQGQRRWREIGRRPQFSTRQCLAIVSGLCRPPSERNSFLQLRQGSGRSIQRHLCWHRASRGRLRRRKGPYASHGGCHQAVPQQGPAEIPCQCFALCLVFLSQQSRPSC